MLSGGERRRVELARILFAGSDVLLLDEPTNHLDSDAKNWLMGFLRAYRGALLVVSHDLNLLDEAITRVLHLDEAQLVEYKGTYSQYRQARAADEVRLDQAGHPPAGRDQAALHPGRLHAPPDGQAGPHGQEPRQAGHPVGVGRGIGAGAVRPPLQGAGSRSRPTPAGWSWRPADWPRTMGGRPYSRT